MIWQTTLKHVINIYATIFFSEESALKAVFYESNMTKIKINHDVFILWTVYPYILKYCDYSFLKKQ